MMWALFLLNWWLEVFIFNLWPTSKKQVRSDRFPAILYVKSYDNHPPETHTGSQIARSLSLQASPEQWQSHERGKQD